jgi:hypothetical protein
VSARKTIVNSCQQCFGTFGVFSLLKPPLPRLTPSRLPRFSANRMDKNFKTFSKRERNGKNTFFASTKEMTEKLEKVLAV